MKPVCVYIPGQVDYLVAFRIVMQLCLISLDRQGLFAGGNVEKERSHAFQSQGNELQRKVWRGQLN